MFLIASPLHSGPQGPTVGLERELQHVRQHVEDPQVSIIGICGMSGIGKTTLSWKIYHEFCSQDKGFDIVMLFDASDSSILEIIHYSVADYVEMPPTWGESAFAKSLHETLSGKRFLIILDNIKLPLSIEKAGIPHPKRNLGSKLLLTSRLHKVSRSMNPDRMIHVALLGEEDAWELFQIHAGIKESDHEVEPIARQIAKACEGLPLSLATVGAASAKLESMNEWANQLDLVLHSTADSKADFSRFSALESSFQALNTDRLRACFLYCSALLEDPSLPVDDLIQYWAEQGILCNGDILNEGKKLLQELENAGMLLIRARSRSSPSRVNLQDDVKLFALCKIRQQFLEKHGFRKTSFGASMFPFFEINFQALGDDDRLKDCLLYFSMLPRSAADSFDIAEQLMIRYWKAEVFLSCADEFNQIVGDLTAKGFPLNQSSMGTEVSISEEFYFYIIMKAQSKGFLVKAGCGLTKAPMNAIKWEDVERASLMHNHIKSLEFPNTINISSLRTLSLNGNIRLKHVSHNIFRSSNLRILDLSSTGIVEIPRAVGAMVSLVNLDLSFTKITSMPREMGRLVNLKFLGMEGTTYLEQFPAKVLSKLSSLVELNMFDSFSDWIAEDPNSPEANRPSLEELECLENLSVIGITIANAAAYEHFLNSQILMKVMERLVVKNCQNLRLSSDFCHVKQLTLSDCFELEELVIGENGTSEYVGERIPQMEALRVVGLYKAQIIWKDISLAGDYLLLRDVTIGFCHELTDVSWLLRILLVRHITIFSCRKLEQLIKDEEESSFMDFHRLKTLRLRKLPSLTSICLNGPEFPALRSLIVLECPQLRKLPIENLAVTALTREKNVEVKIIGKKEWWEGLEWMDFRVKQVLDEHFQAE